MRLLTCALCLLVTITAGPGAAVLAGTPDYAIIHYVRAAGDYGDHTTGDYNDFWGIHLWGVGIDAGEITAWTTPKPFLGEDEYGRFAWVKLVPGATEVNFIVHKGDDKDGTNLDRAFNPAATPEIWLKGDDAVAYASRAAAQGFVTIRYHRDDGDYGDPTSPDFNDFWGLHLWGGAIDPSEQTSWTAPRGFDGIDDYGAVFFVLLQDPSQPVNFIVHRGDQKDPAGSPDRSFDPLDTASIWLQSGDLSVFPQRGAAEGFATIHYHRDDGDYGDPTSSDFNDFWGMHVWTGAADPTASWTDPLRPESPDLFGARFRVDLVPGATELAYIIHRGDDKDPGPDQFLRIGTYGHEVWQLENADPFNPYILPIVMPQDSIESHLVEEVEALVGSGALSWGQGNALLSKLDVAIKKLDQGRETVAINLLQAFIDQVSDFISDGILAPAEGEPLIDAAEEIIAALGG